MGLRASKADCHPTATSASAPLPVPPLFHPVLPVQASNAYPIDPATALLTPGVLVVRRPGTYTRCASLGEVAVVTAAMPCGAADRRPKGGWAGSPWATAVAKRVRAVLHAAALSGRSNLVLGAFGCGAFGNPPRPVAAIIREQLAVPQFRGAFRAVVFAVLDPLGTGNLRWAAPHHHRTMRVAVLGRGRGCLCTAGAQKFRARDVRGSTQRRRRQGAAATSHTHRRNSPFLHLCAPACGRPFREEVGKAAQWKGV